MINLLNLYLQDVSTKLLSVSGGREYRGPCPGCGGQDRFGVFPGQNDGEGSFFCGRASGGGKGCGKGGDAIAYLRSFRGMSYSQACRFLGKEPKGGGGRHFLYATPRAPQKPVAEKFIPSVKDYPEEVVDPALWQKKGFEFIETCHQALLNSEKTIAYLANRGISMKSIRKYRLGFHAGATRKGQPLQMEFRPWPSWGLKGEKKADGKHQCIKLVAGLVIPYIVGEELHRITIRLAKPGPKEGKYDYVRGSRRDLWLSNPTAKAFVTAEAELDCIAIDEAAGDLVGTVGIGSTGVKPDLRTAAALEKSLCILGGLDNDKAGINGGQWWEENYRQYKRWPVPGVKDPGDLAKYGSEKLRLWVESGLPPGLRKNFLQPTSPQTKNVHPDIAELYQLLKEANGFMRIFDQGYGLGHQLPTEWKYENWSKVGRINQLFYQSDAVGNLIDNLADGLYGAANFPLIGGSEQWAR